MIIKFFIFALLSAFITAQRIVEIDVITVDGDRIRYRESVGGSVESSPMEVPSGEVITLETGYGYSFDLNIGDFNGTLDRDLIRDIRLLIVKETDWHELMRYKDPDSNDLSELSYMIEGYGVVCKRDSSAPAILSRHGNDNSHFKLHICPRNRLRYVLDDEGYLFSGTGIIFIEIIDEDILLKTNLRVGFRSNFYVTSEDFEGSDNGSDNGDEENRDDDTETIEELIQDETRMLEIADRITLPVLNDDFDDENCAICLGTITDDINPDIDPKLLERLTICSHVFHRYCLRKYISQSLLEKNNEMPRCPYCRKDFQENKQ